MRLRARGSSEDGFTMMEVMVALVVSIIGLAGVLMMQSSTARANRESIQFTRAANIAEETMESLRGSSIVSFEDGGTYEPIVYGGVSYNIGFSTTELTANLITITVTVSYDEDGDLVSSDDDRRVVLQMVRTKTELL